MSSSTSLKTSRLATIILLLVIACGAALSTLWFSLTETSATTTLVSTLPKDFNMTTITTATETVIQREVTTMVEPSEPNTITRTVTLPPITETVTAGQVFTTTVTAPPVTKTVTVTTTQEASILEIPLPVVTGTGLSSESIRLNSFIGQKPVLVEFMVSWCSHCQNMVPTVEELHSRYSGSIEFISVAAAWRGANADTTAEFIRKFNASWPHVLDSNNEVFDFFGVTATPSYLLFNSNGELAERIVGKVPLETLASELARLS